MKILNRIISFLLVWGFTGIVLAAGAKPLILATEATYPPFESINSQGQMVGFDIDVLNAICAHINKSCQFVSQPWDSLIPGLQLGKFDVIFGSMAITPQRQKQVDFTAPYYNSSAAFVAAKNKHLDLKNLNGQTIGVQGSTTFDDYLRAVYGKKIQINRYGSIQDAFLDLQSGRVDAIFGDTPIMLAWLKITANKNSYEVVGNPISDAHFFGSGNGFAVKKGNAVLLQQLNEGMKAIQDNGALAKMIQQYFEIIP